VVEQRYGNRHRQPDRGHFRSETAAAGDPRIDHLRLHAGLSPPCPPRDMRQHPIGTGPFKFVEFRPNERITVTRNPDYWKNGRPYLDGIEFTIIRDVSTGQQPGGALPPGRS